ncbi:CCD22 protein, partial [Dicaeum eximium]|nr:CCD22 protein [Dicaeum eximium]
YLERKRLQARLRALESLRQACPPRPQGLSLGPPLDPAWLQEAFGAGGAGGALPKGSRFTRTQHLTHEQVGGMRAGVVTPGPPTATCAPQDARSRQASEEAALEETLARLEAEIEGCRGEIRAAQLSLTQAEAEVRQGRGALGGREDALRVKARAVELLPDAQNNMAKLQ